MYCAESAEEAEEGWGYFHNQLSAAQHHYFDWNNPGYEGIHGYEEYLERQTADVGPADAGFEARRETQPIGTPDEIIDRIKTLQRALSLETIVVHVFYGGMPRGQGRKEPPPLCREGPPRGAGHAHPDQSRIAGPARPLIASCEGVIS